MGTLKTILTILSPGILLFALTCFALSIVNQKNELSSLSIKTTTMLFVSSMLLIAIPWAFYLLPYMIIENKKTNFIFFLECFLTILVCILSSSETRRLRITEHLSKIKYHIKHVFHNPILQAMQKMKHNKKE